MTRKTSLLALCALVFLAGLLMAGAFRLRDSRRRNGTGLCDRHERRPVLILFRPFTIHDGIGASDNLFMV